MAGRAENPKHEQPVILASAVTIIEAVLERFGIALAAPPAARFRTDERGSSGIEVTITLREPHRAEIARRAIADRLGGESHSDRLIFRAGTRESVPDAG